MATSRKSKKAAALPATATDGTTTAELERDTSSPKKAPKRKPRAESAPAIEVPPPDADRDRPPKQKPVRDSFTMPKADFALIDALKDRAVGFKRPTRKSELLRAGLHALMALPDDALQNALEQLAPLKTGRPRKSTRG